MSWYKYVYFFILITTLFRVYLVEDPSRSLSSNPKKDVNCTELVDRLWGIPHGRTNYFVAWKSAVNNVLDFQINESKEVLSLRKAYEQVKERFPQYHYGDILNYVSNHPNYRLTLVGNEDAFFTKKIPLYDSLHQKVWGNFQNNQYIDELKPFLENKTGFLLRRFQHAFNNRFFKGYLKSRAAKETIEILYISRAGVIAGHLAVRVDNKVYEIVSKKGILIRDFEEYIETHNSQQKRVYGYAFKANEIEKKKVVEYFKTNQGKVNYNFFYSNCSQNVCRSLKHANIIDFGKLRELDPLVASQILEDFRERGYQLVYNVNHDASRQDIAWNIAFRGGSFTAIGGGLYLSSIGLVELSHFVHNLINAKED